MAFTLPALLFINFAEYVKGFDVDVAIEDSA
jgi:hypothetical protein